MTRDDLQSLLDAEIRAWSAKPLRSIIDALQSGEVNYERQNASGAFQFAVTLLESKPDLVHIAISVDDGSLRRSLIPLTSSFIVHSDGRIDL